MKLRNTKEESLEGHSVIMVDDETTFEIPKQTILGGSLNEELLTLPPVKADLQQLSSCNFRTIEMAKTPFLQMVMQLDLFLLAKRIPHQKASWIMTMFNK
jgi:hypothetical protein